MELLHRRCLKKREFEILISELCPSKPKHRQENFLSQSNQIILFSIKGLINESEFTAYAISHSYELTVNKPNLLQPTLYFLSSCRHWSLYCVQSIVLGTGCITPCNYIAYNQVQKADKKVNT